MRTEDSDLVIISQSEKRGEYWYLKKVSYAFPCGFDSRLRN